MRHHPGIDLGSATLSSMQGDDWQHLQYCTSFVQPAAISCPGLEALPSLPKIAQSFC
jgi:hypothetical protein